MTPLQRAAPQAREFVVLPVCPECVGTIRHDGAAWLLTAATWATIPP